MGWLSNPAHGRQEFQMRGVTKQSFPLVIASRYNIPYLIDRPGLGHQVQGEIYSVDDSMLSKLDELEDHPRFDGSYPVSVNLISRYYRRRHEDIVTTNGEELSCWVTSWSRPRKVCWTFPCCPTTGPRG